MHRDFKIGLVVALALLLLIIVYFYVSGDEFEAPQEGAAPTASEARPPVGAVEVEGEEANEVYSTREQEALATKLQQIDPYNHPVTVHRKSPWPFVGNKFFDLTSIQIGDGSQDLPNGMTKSHPISL